MCLFLDEGGGAGAGARLRVDNLGHRGVTFVTFPQVSKLAQATVLDAWATNLHVFSLLVDFAFLWSFLKSI